MRVWRISRSRHARRPLSGRGGLFASGRWHSRGRRIVYTSSTLSLAALEVLVHTDQDLIPDDLVQMEIEIPDGISMKSILVRSLPRGWRAYPGSPVLRKLGDEWLDGAESGVLRVPSAVIPQEHNFLLNPAHPEAARFRVVSRSRFVLDPRLIQ